MTPQEIKEMFPPFPTAHRPGYVTYFPESEAWREDAYSILHKCEVPYGEIEGWIVWLEGPTAVEAQMNRKDRV